MAGDGKVWWRGLEENDAGTVEAVCRRSGRNDGMENVPAPQQWSAVLCECSAALSELLVGGGCERVGGWVGRGDRLACRVCSGCSTVQNSGKLSVIRQWE